MLFQFFLRCFHTCTVESVETEIWFSFSLVQSICADVNTAITLKYSSIRSWSDPATKLCMVRFEQHVFHIATFAFWDVADYHRHAGVNSPCYPLVTNMAPSSYTYFCSPCSRHMWPISGSRALAWFVATHFWFPWCFLFARKSHTFTNS